MIPDAPGLKNFFTNLLFEKKLIFHHRQITCGSSFDILFSLHLNIEI